MGSADKLSVLCQKIIENQQPDAALVAFFSDKTEKKSAFGSRGGHRDAGNFPGLNALICPGFCANFVSVSFPAALANRRGRKAEARGKRMPDIL